MDKESTVQPEARLPVMGVRGAAILGLLADMFGADIRTTIDKIVDGAEYQQHELRMQEIAVKRMTRQLANDGKRGGSRPCDCCGKTISSNKDMCASCQDRAESQLDAAYTDEDVEPYSCRDAYCDDPVCSTHGGLGTESKGATK